jgi:hypothetical protein
VAERLRQAELAHAAEVARTEEAQATAAQERKAREAAQARAAAEWRARRLTLGLAAAILALVAVGLWVPFLMLIAVAFGAALGTLARGLWRVMRGPRRLAGITWAVLGLLPPLFWLTLGWYGQRQWGSRNVPHNLQLALVRMAGANLMEAQASCLYPHRLETDRLVMFYGDGVIDRSRWRGEADRRTRGAPTVPQ